jgi:membrane fusion protein, type I secretion system
MTPQAKTSHRSIRSHVIAGIAAGIVLVAGVGGWAMTTELAGAVVGSGQLVVDSNVKKVQHPTGGVIGELRVREGDRVAAGDVLLRLDETVTRANLTIVIKSLDELSARQARLEAERDNAEAVAFPDALTARAGNLDVSRTMAGEQKLFELRKTSRQGQKAQLRERIGQLAEEISGLAGQADAKRREIELINRELEGVRDLWTKNLIPISRVTALEREAVRLDGERNQLTASVAQSKGKTTEIELQIIQIDQDLRTEVAKELAEIRGKTAELVERQVAAEDQLKRVDIRAPQSGVVLQLAVHTVGGVINPSEPLMLIVPEGDELTVEARVAPQDIDQLALGQPAVLRFAAFNQRTTPEIVGVVAKISADVTQDPKTGAAFYVLRITMPREQIARLGGLKLVPGMPVETFVQTGERTVMSYLVKPLHDQIMKAFRER